MRSSIASRTRRARTMRARMRPPSSTAATRSRSSISSQAIQGSHSAPLRTSSSTGRPSLSAVGKAAPPRPTIPASSIRARSSAGSRSAQSGSGGSRSVAVSAGSTSSTMQGPGRPLACGTGWSSIARTTPAAGACRWAPRPSARAMRWPRATRALTATFGTAAWPACWPSGRMSTGGSGQAREGSRVACALCPVSGRPPGKRCSRSGVFMTGVRPPPGPGGAAAAAPVASRPAPVARAPSRCSRPGRVGYTARSRCIRRPAPCA